MEASLSIVSMIDLDVDRTAKRLIAAADQMAAAELWPWLSGPGRSAEDDGGRLAEERAELLALGLAQHVERGRDQDVGQILRVGATL